MAGNTFGRILRLTTFGESHGPAIGGILDGCPAGLKLDKAEIQEELDRRRPGVGISATQRKESDQIQLLSGIFEGYTTGTPIGFIIANEDQRSKDYGNLAEIFRPGHADWTYFCKYLGIRDFRGGGRSSGRETACRVAAGAIAKKILACHSNTIIYAACVELGGVKIPHEEIDLKNSLSRPFYAASEAIVPLWEEKIAQARKEKDSLGGVVQIVAVNVPPGLGEPVFDKLDAMLAYALMGVGAVKGVDVGAGIKAAGWSGSVNNDTLLPGNPPFQNNKPNPMFASNNAGGILGGISTGQDIILHAYIKPIASISRTQMTIDCKGNPACIEIGGRHDISAIPRIIPVLSAMTALTLADALLMQLRMTALP